MRIILILWILLSSLWANCTNKQITQAQTLYTQATETQSKKEQINFLYSALGFCYSAEIEANFLILKAEDEVKMMEKINYYKKALLSISKFQDKNLLLQNQDELNLILSKLYAPIDIEISKEYKNKVRRYVNKENLLFKYLFLLMIFLVVFWGIINLLNK